MGSAVTPNPTERKPMVGPVGYNGGACVADQIPSTVYACSSPLKQTCCQLILATT